MPANRFDISKVHVGNYSYGEIVVINFSDRYSLTIGNYCSIATGSTFIVCGDHYLNHISTFPFKVMCLQNEKFEAISNGDIIIEDDVWIGENAVILSGVHIGQGAVIAAGAVVTRDIPPYSIVAGVPAKILRYRFDQDVINELLKIDFGSLTRRDIKIHEQELYETITSVDDALRLTKWMPRKQE